MKKELRLGMKVNASDGTAGSLARIVADAETREPAYLVIATGGPPLLSRQVVVPVSLVTDVAEDRLLLGTTRDALQAFPDYEVVTERQVERPLETPKEPDYLDRWPEVLHLPTIWSHSGSVKVHQRTVPEHTADVRQGMTVYDSTGEKLGTMDGAITDAQTRQITHLVLQRARPLGQDRRLVPVDLVDFVVRSDVYLQIGKQYVDGLPPYQPPEK